MIAMNANDLIGRFVNSDFFQASLKVRDCDFDPTGSMQVTEYFDTPGFGDITMKPEGKAQWFQMWCQKNGKEGRILTEIVRIDQYSEGTLLVQAKAAVYIGDTLVAEDVAGRAVNISRMEDMDSALQIAASVAKGRALSNAGFGACCSVYNVEFNPSNANNGANTISSEDQPLPFVVPGAVISAKANSAVPTQPHEMNSNPGVSDDPIARAKAMVWEYEGEFKGLSLGEILATKPHKIVSWFSTNRCRDDKIRQAAQALIPEAKKILGQAT